MGMAADHARMLGKRALDALFELAHAQHVGEDPDLPLGVGWLHAHSIPLDSGDRHRGAVRWIRRRAFDDDRKSGRSIAIGNRAARAAKLARAPAVRSTYE